MTDLAAPLLYVFEGDPVKSFWCFVGLLNLTKKNFEMEQTTVKNLLIKLFKLVNLTDPCFAEFLGNCRFPIAIGVSPSASHYPLLVTHAHHVSHASITPLQNY